MQIELGALGSFDLLPGVRRSIGQKCLIGSAHNDDRSDLEADRQSPIDRAPSLVLRTVIPHRVSIAY